MKSLALASSIPLVLFGCAASSAPPPTEPQPASSEKVAVVDLNAPKEASAAPKEEPPPAAPEPEKGALTKEKEGTAPLRGVSGTSDQDTADAIANAWGNSLVDSNGAGGLGLAGVGTGGGGQGTGIALGSLGPLGRGGGPSTGSGSGRGLGGIGSPGGKTPPKMVMGATTVSGRLPPEVVQRIVRQNFGRFRLCYEKGLLNNPKLEGSVNVKFVIGKDGSVTSATNNGSDLPDTATINCVAQAFKTIAFPSPEGGVVSVVYPLKFSPGSDAPPPATPAASAPAAPSAAPAPAAKP